MAVAVYKAIRARDRAYIQSTAGVGKTIVTLFPAVKALGLGLATKIFYLTAKTSGRLVAEKALEDMHQSDLYVRSVTLTARKKICFCPPVNCDPQVCIFARGYFDKVKSALTELAQHQTFTRPVSDSSNWVNSGGFCYDQTCTAHCARSQMDNLPSLDNPSM